MPDKSKNQVSIMDIDFINMTKQDFLNYHLYPCLNRQQKCFIVTANPEIVMQTKEDNAYKIMVQSANYVVPDGAGIVMASKYMKQPIKERIPGFDLMLDLLEFCEIQGLSCYFLGAKDYVNEKVVLEVERKYPELTIAGHHHGFFQLDDPKIADQVRGVNPDVIFVALGSPRQETWITNHMDTFSNGLFMGVGGSFDVLANEVKRAPDKWIKLNLEWLYRLLKQPFRWKRTLKAMEFMFRVIFNKQ